MALQNSEYNRIYRSKKYNFFDSKWNLLRLYKCFNLSNINRKQGIEKIPKDIIKSK